MTCGIYRFDFSNGCFYVGKSANIEKRWGQHRDNMVRGTHTKAVQAVYAECGLPEFTIVTEVHEHHLDIIENHYIAMVWDIPGCLNSTAAKDIGDFGRGVIEDFSADYWRQSTFDHITQVEKLKREYNALQLEFEGTLDGTREQALEQERDVLQELLEEAREYNTWLINRGFWARLFNRL